MTILLCLLIFLPKILAGFAVAHLLWKDLDFPAVLLKLSIGVPLGLGMSAGLFFLALAAGIPPSTYSLAEFWIVLSIVLLFLIHRIFIKKETVSFAGLSWQDGFGALILLAGAFLTTSAILYFSRLHPYGFEDAWSIWNLPARFLYRDDSGSILLQSELYNRFHPDYPVALSLNVAWGWFFLKNETTRLPMAIALLATLSSGLVAWGALRKWKGALAAALAGLVILITSNFPAVVGQYADPWLALYILSAAAMFFGFLKNQDPNLLILASLLAGFSAWMKNEGLLFIAVFIMVCLFAAWRRIIPWKSLRSLALGLILPILIVIMFKWTVAWQSDLVGSTNSPLTQILDVSRWALITRNFIFYLWNYANWPISVLALLTIYALLVGFDSREFPNQILLLLLLLGQWAGYFFIYLITPHNLQMHVTTSMDRLISHLFPLAVLWLFVALRSPDLRLAGRSNSRKDSRSSGGW